MKIKLMSIYFVFLLASCNYTSTSFFIENKSDTKIYFDATAIIPHRLTLNTQSFQVAPRESVLLRHVDLSPSADITNLFTEIIFKNYTVDSLTTPMNPANWIEKPNENGNRTFIYTID